MGVQFRDCGTGMEHEGREMKLHEFIITAIIMWIIAWMFVKGWDATEYVDQARRAEYQKRLMDYIGK